MTATPTATDRVVLDFSGYGLTEVPLVGRYTYTRAHPPLRMHIHEDVFEVCVLQRGTQTYVIGEKHFDLLARDMIIIRPGQVHGTGTEPENCGRLYWIQFQRPSRSRSFLGLPHHTAHRLIESLNHLQHPQFHNCEILFETFERLLSFPLLATTPKALAKASLQNLLVRLLLDILSLTSREAPPACSVGVRRALKYLLQHSAEHVTLAQVASAVGTSKSYMNTHFKREVGMTPMEYLLRLRIENAKRYLRTMDTPITDLALQSGFATSQHFATAFKRLTGHTPRDFRHLPNGEKNVAITPIVGKGPLFHPVDAVLFSKHDARCHLPGKPAKGKSNSNIGGIRTRQERRPVFPPASQGAQEVV